MKNSPKLIRVAGKVYRLAEDDDKTLQSSLVERATSSTFSTEERAETSRMAGIEGKYGPFVERESELKQITGPSPEHRKFILSLPADPAEALNQLGKRDWLLREKMQISGPERTRAVGEAFRATDAKAKNLRLRAEELDKAFAQEVWDAADIGRRIRLLYKEL